MKHLLAYFKGNRRDAILAPLFKMLEASFELFVPYVVAAVIDTAIPSGDRSLIFNNFLILVALGLVGLAASLTAQYFAARAATSFAARLRSAVFGKVQTLSFTQLDTAGSSGLITRLTSDIDQVQTGVNLVLRLFLRSPVIVFGAVIMAYTVSPKDTLTFGVTVLALFIIVFGILLLSIPLFKRVQGKLEDVLLRTKEALEGVRVIRAFNRQAKESEGFSRDNEALTALSRKAQGFSTLMNPMTTVVVNLAIVVLLQTGAARVDNGLLSRGMLVALVNYMSQILIELVKLANLVITTTKSFACADRIADLLNTEEETVPASRADRRDGTAVSFDHVSFTYRNAGGPAISDITFTAAPGEKIGVIGGTGSGKSTLVKMIPAFYYAREGAVSVNGRDVCAWDAKKLRASIGYVPQKGTLFHGSVRDNMRLGAPDATDEEIETALKDAQAWEFMSNKEGVLEFELAQGGKNLSGGQRQRLLIARALIGKPEILIFDDATSALDYATEAKLRQALSSYRDMTVITVSQRIASVSNADRILVMDDGRLIGDGTHAELLRTCAAYREFACSQLKGEEAAV